MPSRNDAGIRALPCQFATFGLVTPSLTEAGVDEVIVDLTWDQDDQHDQVALLRGVTAPR